MYTFEFSSPQRERVALIRWLRARRSLLTLYFFVFSGFASAPH